MQYSIVYYSEVKEIFDCRMDAEYWHPAFIENSKLVSGELRIRDFVHPNITNIKSSPINRDFEYLEISRISLSNCAYETIKVPFGEEPDRAHHILEKGDVVVSTVRPNRNAVAFIRENSIIGSSGLSVLRAKNIEAEYLLTFCKTNYFVQCLMRTNKASMYPAVSNADVLDMPLFVPSNAFRSFIVKTVRISVSCLDQAQHSYRQAEGILLDEMGLVDWRPKHCLSFVRNYADTQRAGRMDADYFQPKYEEIIHAIQSYAAGYDTLENLTNLKDRNYHPKHGQEYKYIELANIGGNGEITGSMQEEGYNLPTRARRKVSSRDVIVSSVEGSLDSIALIGAEYDNALCSTGFYVVNSKNLNSETLLVLLKSPIGQLQLKKGCSGTILTAISKDEFSKIVFPKIKAETQIQIRQRVAEAFALRRRSKHLLECAKRAVELAIEQDEQIALDWLEAQTK